ncbi:HD-GYP domain-containing protein [Parasphingorhabdus cellanae]|uniref:HD-GYP domain-containing protein n=2 Tax=Parasphingorhabdus cellanae TaxID=2806553 RepID=A0ABX7T7Z0_9SPHN|nr:HD-GYP domain-containing protein [Parasphingorhabdus cellanae]
MFQTFDQSNTDTSPATTIKLGEVLSAFSYALDLTQGQPQGHCIRACWIGTKIGSAINLREEDQRELYFTVLLKDLGCSSNAARICELYLADDLAVKRDYKLIDGKTKNVLQFVLSRTAADLPISQRISALANVIVNGAKLETDIIATRCIRGADIARKLRFSEDVAEGIAGLDEHWNGSGKPAMLKGEQIPLFSRIALIAQVADIFCMANGPDAAREEIEKRKGTWFDPDIANVFLDLAADETFWTELQSPDIETKVMALEPAKSEIPVTEAYLDDIAIAFGQVIDAKSPYTAGHSERVGKYATGIALRLGYNNGHIRKLRRAAILHDIGKLGVSNLILDKPAKLSDDEWDVMRGHSQHTAEILGRIAVFKEMAKIAGAHHERLDGTGYPNNLSADDICMDTRIITIADFYDALTSDRPYRPAMSRDEAMDIIRSERGKAIDETCFDALVSMVTKTVPKLPAGMAKSKN